VKIVALCLFFASQIMAYSFFESDKSIDKRHLDVIHAVKDTVISTQKTRGLTNNYMNGNVVAQLLVYGQRKQMLKNFTKIDNNFKRLELSSEYYKKASELMNRSKKLNKMALSMHQSVLMKGRVFKHDSGKIFASYSRIIEGWMDLNKDMIKVHFSKRDTRTYEKVKLLNNVLLPLTENIGKMRGMGSGIVARTYCKDKEALEMRGFVDEIQRYLTLLEGHLSSTSYSALHKQETHLIKQNIKDYADKTRTEVIDKSDIKLVTNEYFDQGTAAISDILKIYNVITHSLEQP